MATPWLNKQVLILGDSLSDGTDGKPGTYGVPPTPPRTPGQFLAQSLEQQGAKPVRIQAKLSRSAYHFVAYQDGLRILADEIANFRPDVVFIILGTNDLNLGEAPTRAAFMKIKAVLDEAKIPVYHVGPPSFAGSLVDREGTSYNTLAEKVVMIGRDLFGARFIDARPMTIDTVTVAQGRSGDLVHFTASGAQRWAGRLSAALTNTLAGAQRLAVAPLGNVARLAGGFVIVGGLATAGLLAYNSSAKTRPVTPLRGGNTVKYAYCGRARVSARQLRMGIEVEHEHTRRFRSKRRAYQHARRTACDHLAPPPYGEGIKDYYTRLARMEREAKARRRA
jgi:lysophospholipase L1-like esterase